MAGVETGVFLGAIVLGTVHGVEPGHGWPVAASYALDKANTWLFGFLASFIIGVGHLISSIAMVGAFFYAKAYFELAEVDEPIRLVGDIYIGGRVSLVAGVLLIALGIREYFYGHSHGHEDDGGHGQGHEHGHSHDHGDGHSHDQMDNHSHGHEDDGGDGHSHDHGDGHSHGHGDDGGDGHSHDPENGYYVDHISGHPHEVETDHGHDHPTDQREQSSHGFISRITSFLPFVGGHDHSHGTAEEAAERGLLGIAWFAFLLGFAHEEEFEIIALCAGSNFCLELMLAYALTVIVAIVSLTLLLIAGYHHFEERVEQYTPYLPAFSAAVLVIMGVGFILGLF